MIASWNKLHAIRHMKNTVVDGVITLNLSSSNEVSGSASFQIIELPAVRRTQPSTKGQIFFNNPCPIATMVTW